MNDILFATLFAITGAVAGSFVNALVWRLHTNKSIVNDRSMCPKCQHQLAVKDLVPVFSWFWLRGKCRYCQQKISPQYPVVELTLAALFAVSYLLWDFSAGGLATAELAVWLFELILLVALIVYDLRWMLLPNRLMVPLVALAVLQLILFLASGLPPAVWFVGPLSGALSAAGAFYLIFWLSKGAWMGGGDVKLVFIMGLILGFKLTVLALFLAFLLGAVISLVLLGIKLRTRKDLIPFGPFLIVGLIIARIAGQPIVDWYLGVVGI